MQHRTTGKFIFAALLFISIFIALFATLTGIKDLMHQAAYRRDLANYEATPWTQTTATLDGVFIFGQATPAVAAKLHHASAFLYPLHYHYSVNGKNCKGRGFELGDDGSDSFPVEPNDTRVNSFINAYCSALPKREKHTLTLYDFTCRPFPVFYNPNHACMSYINKPLHPDRLYASLDKKAIETRNDIILFIGMGVLCAFGFMSIMRLPVAKRK